MPSLDDYLNGKPLTEELARMQAGEEPEEPTPVQPMRVVGGRMRPLDDDDREHLRRLRLEPGWPILLNLLDSQVQKQEDALRRASKDDPFNRQNQAGWARIGALEEARKMLEQTIEAEVMQMGQGDEEDA